VREFFYGLILGAAAMYCYQYFDAPGIVDYLNGATAAAVKSTSGYGGKDKAEREREQKRY